MKNINLHIQKSSTNFNRINSKNPHQHTPESNYEKPMTDNLESNKRTIR